MLLIFSLSSCFKKEEPIVLPNGDSELASFYLGPGYEKDVFFDLSTNTYQERKRADWDIRFEASKDGYGVYINTAKNMVVRRIGLKHLNEPAAVDTNDFKNYAELLEPPEGIASKSAMGDWQSYNEIIRNDTGYGIYVLELRYNTGYARFKRIQILDVDDDSYSVVITDLVDKNGDTIISGQKRKIPKDPNQNFTYYSLADTGRILENTEPDKHTWDFVFTRYKQWMYGGFYGPITGVLSNSNKVEVARDSAMNSFDAIDKNSINKYNFITNMNGIGYDWKTWTSPGGGGGTYIIAPKLTFIIKDTDGNYYKLRFLDYYSNLGVVGNPKFEFIKIQ